MDKPIIGVMPLWDEEKKSLWMLPGYMEGVIEAGGIPVMMPLTDDEYILEKLINSYDGFLFTGGQDVSPSIYNEEIKYDNVITCEKRDKMEEICLKLIMKKNKPILGICRGIQFINASLGGSLYQDLKTEHKSNICHTQQAPYDNPCHEVKILNDTPLYNSLGVNSIMVNSYHHQAINNLANDLEPMAISIDGLIEAVYMSNYSFLWAIQWHPEFSYKNDIYSKGIFKSFIESMKKKYVYYAKPLYTNIKNRNYK